MKIEICLKKAYLYCATYNYALIENDKYVLNVKEYTMEKHGYIRFKTFEVESKTDSSVVFLHKSDEETNVE